MILFNLSTSLRTINRLISVQLSSSDTLPNKQIYFLRSIDPLAFGRSSLIKWFRVYFRLHETQCKRYAAHQRKQSDDAQYLIRVVKRLTAAAVLSIRENFLSSVSLFIDCWQTLNFDSVIEFFYILSDSVQHLSCVCSVTENCLLTH